MKNRFVGIILFWVAAIGPFAGVLLIGRVFGSYWFVIFLFIYALIYRPILHIIRLLSLGVIEEKDAWKFFLPFYQNKYFKTLWFG